MFRTVVCLSLLGALASIVFKLLLTMDINKRVYNHRPGACRKVEGIQYGAEDIALLEDEGIAIVTSGIVYMEPRKKEVKGQLFLYDFRQNGTWRAVPMKINGKYDQENFHPHGISHVITSSGARFFVIVHSKKFEHSVMILDWNRKNWLELDLVRIIKDEKFIRPNDLVAIDENSFILTNDGYAQTSFFNILELISSYPSGSVVYYDGKASSYMISRSVSPNGIILNKERTHVIISHVNSETISVYKLNKDNHSLSRVVDVPILTTADNFCVDKSGAIWTGAHPVLKDALSLLSNFDDVNAKAPSQVLRIVFSKDFKSWEITEPFSDDGRLVSASSIAVPYGNQLLIGSVCRELVHCNTSPETI